MLSTRSFWGKNGAAAAAALHTTDAVRFQFSVVAASPPSATENVWLEG